MKAKAAATPAVLIVLAVAAVGYAYWGDRSVSDAERAERKRDVFPSFRVDDVTRLEMAHGAEAFALERAEDAGAPRTWLIDQPRHEPADQAAVDLLLRELELATRLRTVTSVPPGAFDAPRVRGQVTVGRLTYRFMLGADALRAEGGAYLRVDGEGTFVVGRSLKSQLLRRRDTYRDRTLLSLGERDVARLEVRGPAGGGVTFERRGSTFRLGELRASRDAVDHLFSALADARADVFLDGETDAASPAPGTRYVVRLVPRGDGRASEEMLVGGECPGEPDGVVARRVSPSPVLACTSKALLPALRVDAATLVDASPLAARPDEIEQVRLEAVPGGARLEMARKGSGWHLRAPADRDLTTEEVESANAFVAALAGARATSVEPAAVPSLPGPRLRVTVTRSGDESTEVVEVSRPDPHGLVLARRADDGAVLHLGGQSAYARILEDPEVLRLPGGVQDLASRVIAEGDGGPLGDAR